MNDKEEVSHELKSVLTIINAGVTVVLDGVLGTINGDQKDALARVKTSTVRLSRLVDKILDFQKMQSGKI